MRKMQMSHGAVDVSNVALLHHPQKLPLTAKLTNFIFAGSGHGANVEKDFRMFAIFISTLFVADHESYEALRTTLGGERFVQTIGAVNERICESFSMLGAQLKHVLSRDLIPADEISELYRDFYRLLNEAGMNQLEQLSEHEAERIRL
jgi:hypothetical protein